LVGFEIFGGDLEGMQESVRRTDVKDRTVEIGQEPFVRIEDETIGLLETGEAVSDRREDRGISGISGIDVKPSAEFFTKGGDGGDRIDSRGGGRSEGGDDTTRDQTVFEVSDEGGTQGVGLEGERAIGGDLSEMILTEACEFDGLFDGRMGFFRSIHAKERGLGIGGPFLTETSEGGGFAGGKEGGEARRGSRVLDRTDEDFGEIKGLTEPVENDLL